MCEAVDRLANKRAEEKRIETLVSSAKSLMNNLKFSFEQAAQVLDISEADKEVIASRIQA